MGRDDVGQMHGEVLLQCEGPRVPNEDRRWDRDQPNLTKEEPALHGDALAVDGDRAEVPFIASVAQDPTSQSSKQQ